MSKPHASAREARTLSRDTRRHTNAELDELLLERERAALERRRVRRAHAYVLPDVAEIRPQLAADIAGDDFAGEPLAEYGA